MKSRRNIQTAGVMLHRLLVYAQSVGFIVAVVLACAGIRSVVYSGSLLAGTGLLVAVLAFLRGLRIGLYFGFAAPTVSVVTFAVIYGLQWSPPDAQLPVSIALVFAAIGHLMLGRAAIRELSNLGYRKGDPFRFQFSIASLLVLMTLTAISFGLYRTGKPVAASAGILLCYLAIVHYILSMSARRSPDVGEPWAEPRNPPESSG